MKRNQLYMVRALCRFLPPVIAQQARARLISNKEAENLAMDFRKKSFTGGYLSSNTRDFHAFKFFVHGYFDWRNIVLVKRILEIENGDIIEVGANIGTETVSLAQLNKSHLVHAFEPETTNSASLQALKKENSFNNLLIYDVLVSDQRGIVNFKIPEVHDSGTGYITQADDHHTKKLQVVSLDEKLSGIKSCTAILIDVEGFEYHVIKGSREIIQKYRPFIILEVNAKYLQKRANVSVSQLKDELERLNYKTFYIDKMGLKEGDIDKFEIKSNKNWLCIPAEKKKYQKSLSRSILINALNPFLTLKIF